MASTKTAPPGRMAEAERRAAAPGGRRASRAPAGRAQADQLGLRGVHIVVYVWMRSSVNTSPRAGTRGPRAAPAGGLQGRRARDVGGLLRRQLIEILRGVRLDAVLDAVRPAHQHRRSPGTGCRWVSARNSTRLRVGARDQDAHRGGAVALQYTRLIRPQPDPGGGRVRGQLVKASTAPACLRMPPMKRGVDGRHAGLVVEQAPSPQRLGRAGPLSPTAAWA